MMDKSILEIHKVIFISEVPDETVRALHMQPAHSIEEAVAMANEALGYEGSITIIPEGVSCIITD